MSTTTTPDTTAFERAVLVAKRSGHQDSNDNEIESLRNAVHIACDLLRVNEDAIDAAAYEWAVKKGLML